MQMFLKKINHVLIQSAFLCRCLFFLLDTGHAFAQTKPAKLTVVMVIDQFGYRSLQRVKPYVTKGLKFLLDHGVVYHKAIMPHGLPTTAPGHTTLQTGTTPSNHGIIANTWRLQNTKEVAVDDDQKYPTFLKNNEGRSPHNIMVKGISDSFVRSSTSQSPKYTFSISGKSRSAICTAGFLGKPIWFDKDIGSFTSSSYYFKKLPAWLEKVNKKQDLYHNSNVISWQPAFSLQDPAYGAVFTKGYAFSAPGASFINTQFHAKEIIKKTHASNPKNKEKAYGYLELTPHINDYIFDCATACIKEHLPPKSKNSMLLWVCISSIDKVGHLMGPDSYEVIDSLYHLDRQIEHFMRKIEKIVKKEDTLFVLTADHGMAEIPEVAHQKGVLHAKRQQKQELIKELNDTIKKQHGIIDACVDIQAANVYFNQQKIQQKKAAVLQTAKKILQTKEFIKNVWTYYELAMLPVQEDSIESFFKNQLFANRSGDIIYQVAPNCLVDDHVKGGSHETPYHDDVHIPLLLYQKGAVEQKQITQNVFATQLAHTLSYLLQVSGPDIGIATEQLLPGLQGDE